MQFILAIDQGTTSSRAIVFDDQMQVVASDQKEFTQHFPASGWVEHDPEEIWQTVLGTCRGRCRRQVSQPTRLRASGSQISAKRLWSGTATQARRCITPSSGRIGARPRFAPN